MPINVTFKSTLLISQGTHYVSCFLWHFFLSVIHILVSRTSSFLDFASFSPAACNASLSPTLPPFLPFLRSLPLSSSVLCLSPVYRLSHSHITAQPAVNDPFAPAGANMNISTSRLSPEFEPSTYLLNVTGVCVQEGKNKLEDDTVSISYTNLQLQMWRGCCG